ncbi:MAG: C10 family peptidase [Planctomycetota bacterium]|jgi:hypothetical protein
MEKLRNTILVAFLLVIGFTIPLQAKKATVNDALTAANNWISLILEKKGAWGDANTAYVEDIREFKRGQRTLGYFCRVWPKGYIVLSLHKQLAPVKVYSATSNLDPDSQEGMTDLIKDRMERILGRVDEWAKKLKAPPDEVMARILEVNYRNAWNELQVDATSFQQQLESDIEPMNYQENQILLSSSWHQEDPYNRQCPLSSGTCTETRCTVGCVATAGAQIARYWNWPPYGLGSPYDDTYDWPNMPDSATGTSTAAQIDAVAELSSEVGIAVAMNYCQIDCESGSFTYDMEGVFENHYRYHTNCVKRDRSSYTAVNWFNMIKAEFNANRPIQYKITGHSIVGDGWQEFGAGPTRQYHMNYGWDDGHTAWYTLDGLLLGDPDTEYIIASIYPDQSLHSVISGTYTKQSFPYRYFNVDATGTSATFEAGQFLQFLPDITVTCTSTSGGSIQFDGSSTNNTILFSNGDSTQGARIYNGTIKMNRYGSIRFN